MVENCNSMFLDLSGFLILSFEYEYLMDGDLMLAQDL